MSTRLIFVFVLLICLLLHSVSAFGRKKKQAKEEPKKEVQKEVQKEVKNEKVPSKSPGTVKKILRILLSPITGTKNAIKWVLMKLISGCRIRKSTKNSNTKEDPSDSVFAHISNFVGRSLAILPSTDDLMSSLAAVNKMARDGASDLKDKASSMVQTANDFQKKVIDAAAAGVVNGYNSVAETYDFLKTSAVANVVGGMQFGRDQLLGIASTLTNTLKDVLKNIPQAALPAVQAIVKDIGVTNAEELARSERFQSLILSLAPPEIAAALSLAKDLIGIDLTQILLKSGVAQMILDLVTKQGEAVLGVDPLKAGTVQPAAAA